MRIGLLGTGHWAAKTQGAALAVHPGVTFVGVWGRDPVKAGAIADRFGVPAYADLDALFGDVDAVAFAVPPDAQAELALRAARQGKHLLLEKPVSLSLPDADALVAAVDEGDLATVVFFTNRFVPAVDSFIGEKAAHGGWYAAHGTHYTSIFVPGGPYAGSLWRKVHGGLWDLGPHALSVILPLLGPVDEVSAADGPRDSVHLLLRHGGGGASTVSLTVNAAPDATAYRFAFFGEHGAVELPPIDIEPDVAFGGAIDALLAGDSTCDVHFGRDVVAVLAAADTARRERRIVPLPT